MDSWLPVVMMLVLGAAFAVGGMLGLAVRRAAEPQPGETAPYECGVPPGRATPANASRSSSTSWR